MFYFDVFIKKFVKLCLLLSNKVQFPSRFDEFFDKNFKVVILINLSNKNLLTPSSGNFELDFFSSLQQLQYRRSSQNCYRAGPRSSRNRFCIQYQNVLHDAFRLDLPSLHTCLATCHRDLVPRSPSHYPSLEAFCWVGSKSIPKVAIWRVFAQWNSTF